jgi:MFS family permease
VSFYVSLIAELHNANLQSVGPDKNYAWIATANIITAAILAPFVGRLGDIFGRRNFLILGDILGMAGTAVCATGHKIPTLIGGSVLIGAGSSMHQMAWACLSEVVPKKSRPMALGLLQTSIGPASAFGPLIGMWSSLREYFGPQANQVRLCMRCTLLLANGILDYFRSLLNRFDTRILLL